VTLALSIGFLVIISAAATEPLMLSVSVLLYACGTISIQYGTELSSRQRFMEQLQGTKVQSDLDLSKARVTKMESAAILHRIQTDLALAQIAQLEAELEADAVLRTTKSELTRTQMESRATKTELTRTQMERTKAEIGGCSTAGQFNILESITKVKRTPKLAEVHITPRTNRNSQLTLLT
jgi:hypothetical protein